MSEYLTPDIKAVFFDHDDTLVGTIEAKFAQHKHVAKTYYNKELTNDELILHWGKPLTDLLKILYGTQDTNKAFTHVLAVHQDFPKLLLADTIPTLQTLHERGLKLGLVRQLAVLALIMIWNRWLFRAALLAIYKPKKIVTIINRIRVSSPMPWSG